MTITAQIITAVVISLGIYDLVVVLRTGVGTSISRVMQRAGLRSPAVVFTVGYICGHIWGYMPPETNKEAQTWQQSSQHKSDKYQTSGSSATSPVLQEPPSH